MQKKPLLAAALGLALVVVVFLIIFRMAGPKASPVPRDARSRYEEASAMIRSSDYGGAIKTLNGIIEKYPDSPLVENSLYSLASVYETKGELLKAQETYAKMVEKFPASNSLANSHESLERIRVRLLFTPTATPDSFIYEVKRGDTLSKIAKNNNTTVELLMKANSLKDGNIKIGKKLKVTKSVFSISVDKSQNILTLKSDGKAMKTYNVATGVNNCTPAGTFKIVNKIVSPVWYAQDAVVPAGSPKNILGSRWMGITQPGYGIHGSTDPSSIGKQATAGCVRMHNSDVEELYAIVPVGTEVIIED